MSTYFKEFNSNKNILKRILEKRMYTLISLRAKIILMAVLIAIIGSNSQTFSATLQSNKELLRIVRDGYQANIERVRTWQGQAEIKTRSKNLGSDQRDTESYAEFVCDNTKQAVRWNWLTSTDIVIEDGVKKNSQPRILNKMSKNGMLYRFGPCKSVRNDGEIRRLNIVSSDGFRPHQNADDFDPMSFLTHPIGTSKVPMLEMLDDYYNIFLDDPNGNAKVLRDGDIVILHIEGGEMISNFEFDLSQGCVLTSYLISDPNSSITYEYEYEQINGASIPKKRIYKNEKPSINRSFMREINFIQNKINEPIPDSEFDIESLGVQPGDIISDRLIGVKYAYKTIAELPDVDGANPKPNLSVNSNFLNKTEVKAQTIAAIEDDANESEITSVLAMPETELSPEDTHLLVTKPKLLAGICVFALCGILAFVYKIRTTKREEVQ